MNDLKMEKKLSLLIEKWQGLLKLQHWHIDYEFCDKEKMGGECHGKNQFNLDHLSAAILFMTEDEFGKCQKDALIKEPYDLEETVVHELVHLVLAPMECSEKDAEEQTVNILTRILLEQQALS